MASPKERFGDRVKWAQKAFTEGHREQEIAALREALYEAQQALNLPADRYWQQ